MNQSAIAHLAEQYHWITINADGSVNLVLDHHMLSGFRTCEQYFVDSILHKYQPKAKSWNLEFGILYHKLIENYYKDKPTTAEALRDWLQSGMERWIASNMDEQFSEIPGYKTLGGLAGFITMLGAYSEHYNKAPERLIPIALEIPFGKALEVPVGNFFITLENGRTLLVRLYLAGRMDFLMDSGAAIGPMDHKTFAFFKGNPAERYETNEGITGYIYATKHLVQQVAPELAANRRLDRAWLNCASLATPKDPNDRFRRVPIFKSEQQLEAWKLRQLRTARLILELMLGNEMPTWDASHCDNMFHKECPFKIVHRLPSVQDQLVIIKNDFTVGEAWDTELL